MHMYAVCEAALELARAWGASPEEAALAALFHDVCRHVAEPPDAAALDALGLPLEPPEDVVPSLWHAGAAVLWMRDRGIENRRVWEAIRYHTTGRPGMTTLDAVLFVADRISADRTSQEAEALRRRAPPRGHLGVREAVREVLALKIRSVEARGGMLHPRTRAALADVDS